MSTAPAERETGELPPLTQGVLLSQAQQPSNAPAESTIVSLHSFEAKSVYAQRRSLRRQMMDVWHERAVILTAEEQRELKDQITHTCEVLTVLTSRS